MRTEFAKLLKQLRKNRPDANVELVRRAYSYADRAHQGQKRLSGDAYITHSLSVAQILAQLGMDEVTISAGLLHDVLEDTSTTLAGLEKEFGDDISLLVDGVTKIGTMHMAKVPPTREQKQAENLRKMLVATAKDVRVILIKLADRLHNLRTIQYLPKDRIHRICQETLDIFGPMANRLGLSHWKWELEDHAFHFLHPEEYKQMAKLVAMKRREREELLNKTIEFLEVRLGEAEVIAHVIGRPKHLYSIYTKMILSGKTFDQVLDILAVRIITQTDSGCYNSLGVVHQLWPPIDGRFKDYIATPKLNMYQSIHTTVKLDDGRILEIQIRTEEMDRASREGIAAHWKYKGGMTKVDQRTEKQLLWLRQMYDWLKDAQAPEELFEILRRDIGLTAVYVHTPKGEVKELPQGATPLDFAYMIHTEIGHHCMGAKVGGSMVPLRYNLQTGDIVEIVTSRNQSPHVDWLEFVVTGRARTRIRQRLREMELLPVVAKKPKSKPTTPKNKPKAKRVDMDAASRLKLIRVEGMEGVETQLAQCCDPIPYEAIIGYITKRHTISVHRADCKLLEKSGRDTSRMLSVTWEGTEGEEMSMRVIMGARPNVLADITSAMRPMNVDVVHAEYHPWENGDSVFDFVFRSNDGTMADRMARLLGMVPGVTSVQTLPTKNKKHR